MAKRSLADRLRSVGKKPKPDTWIETQLPSRSGQIKGKTPKVLSSQNVRPIKKQNSAQKLSAYNKSVLENAIKHKPHEKSYLTQQAMNNARNSVKAYPTNAKDSLAHYIPQGGEVFLPPVDQPVQNNVPVPVPQTQSPLNAQSIKDLIAGSTPTIPTDAQAITSGGGQPNALQQLMQQGGGQYPLTPEQEAQMQVDLEYKPKMSAIQAALQAAQNKTKQGVSELTGFGDLQGKNLQDVYAALGGQLQQGVTAEQGAFDAQKQSSKDIFEQLLNRQQTTEGSVENSLKANAEKLGLTEALDDPTQRLKSTLSELQGVSQAQQQNVQGALGLQAANELAYGNRGVAQAGQEGALAQRDLANSIAKSVAQMKLQGQQQASDYTRQLTDLTSQQSTALAKLVNDIKQSRTQQEKQDAQDAFAQYIQEQTLEIQKQRLGLEGLNSDRDYGIQMAKLQNDLAQTSDPLKQMKLQLEIQKLQNDVNESGTYGQSKLDQFFNTPQPGYWGTPGTNAQVAGQNVREAVQTIISAANQKAIEASNNAETGIATNPYTIATSLIPQYNALNPQALLAALQIYYGKNK